MGTCFARSTSLDVFFSHLVATEALVPWAGLLKKRPQLWFGCIFTVQDRGGVGQRDQDVVDGDVVFSKLILSRMALCLSSSEKKMLDGPLKAHSFSASTVVVFFLLLPKLSIPSELGIGP